MIVWTRRILFIGPFTTGLYARIIETSVNYITVLILSGKIVFFALSAS